MKYAIMAAALAITPAAAQEMSSAEFFTRDKTNNWTRPIHQEVVVSKVHSRRMNRQQKYVYRKIIAEVKVKLGSKWVKPALRLAKIESGYRCGAVGPRTRHGRAVGVFQVLPKSARALGYHSVWRLKECDYGIAAGIAHMQSCLDSGVKTMRQMASCHVSGIRGWKIKLSRRHERYKQFYIRLAMRREQRRMY